jgi:hypothetical protein
MSEDIIHDKAAFEAHLAQGTYVCTDICVYKYTCIGRTC